MTNLCSRCTKRPASTKPYKGSPPDGLCPACRYALKRNPHAARRAQSDGMVGKPIEDRFWAKVSKPDGEDGCWIWTARRDKNGYGQFHDGRTVRAMRWAYERFVGPISEDKVLDHIVCSNTSCVNPHHMVPSTNRDNVIRGVGPGHKNAAKTHCPQGHEFTPDNTLWFKQSGGRGVRDGRRCLTCHREQSRRASAKYAAKKKAALPKESGPTS